MDGYIDDDDDDVCVFYLLVRLCGERVESALTPPPMNAAAGVRASRRVGPCAR